MPKSPRRQTLSPIKKQPHNSFINEERIKPPSPRQTQSSKLQSSKPLEKITEEKIIEE